MSEDEKKMPEESESESVSPPADGQASESLDPALSQDEDAFEYDEDVERLAASMGIQVSELFSWNIKPTDVLYLLNRCPFLQLVDSKLNTPTPDDEPLFITARSGWKIYDYGNALSSSPGLFLFGGGNFAIPDDGDKEGGTHGGGPIVNPGKGTIINQAFETAVEMVEIADERLWEGLIVVDGHPMMQWAAWAEAYDRGFVIEGFEPTQADFIKRERIRRTEEDIKELREKIRLRQSGMR